MRVVGRDKRPEYGDSSPKLPKGNNASILGSGSIEVWVQPSGEMPEAEGAAPESQVSSRLGQ